LRQTQWINTFVEVQPGSISCSRAQEQPRPDPPPQGQALIESWPAWIRSRAANPPNRASVAGATPRHSHGQQMAPATPRPWGLAVEPPPVTSHLPSQTENGSRDAPTVGGAAIQSPLLPAIRSPLSPAIQSPLEAGRRSVQRISRHLRTRWAISSRATPGFLVAIQEWRRACLVL